MNPLGRHLLLEIWEGDPLLLNDPARVERALREAALATNSTLIDLQVHAFPHMGVTGLALLAESHISIHTWPEKGYAAVDVFTCGRRASPEAAVGVMEAIFTPGRTETMLLERGVPLTTRVAG